jgi:hypothetical protein
MVGPDIVDYIDSGKVVATDLAGGPVVVPDQDPPSTTGKARVSRGARARLR